MASHGFRRIALVGDTYVRRRLREGLGAPFEQRRHGMDQRRCEVGVARVGDRTFIDFGDAWSEARAEVRTAALVELSVDLLVVGYAADAHAVARDLTEARRAGVCDAVGVLRTGTHASAKDDAEATVRGEQAFASLARWVGVASRALVRADGAESGALAAFVNGNQPSRPPAEQPSSRQVLLCDTCGVPVTSAVQIGTWADVGVRWEGEAGGRDESLAPPGHAIRGDGSSMAGYWALREGCIYVHEVDLLLAEDNGKGIAITCCGARPDPESGPNLDCPNGHPVGDLFTDCCAPQGGHIEIARVRISPS